MITVDNFGLWFPIINVENKIARYMTWSREHIWIFYS